MPVECFFKVSSTNFPESDRLIPRAGEHKISLGIEVNIGYIVVVAAEGLEAEVVVVDIPDFNGEIGGAGGEVAALVIEIDVIDGV